MRSPYRIARNIETRPSARNLANGIFKAYRGGNLSMLNLCERPVMAIVNVAGSKARPECRQLCFVHIAQNIRRTGDHGIADVPSR